MSDYANNPNATPWAPSYAPNTMPSPNAVERLNGALNVLSDTARQAEQLADDLCGAVPQAVSKDSAASMSGGVFGQIGMGAEAVNAFSSRIQNAISRIRNQMP